MSKCKFAVKCTLKLYITSRLCRIYLVLFSTR